MATSPQSKPFLHRIAEETVEPNQEDLPAIRFANDHKTNIFRSLEPSPSRFRDLKPISGGITLQDFLVSPYLSGSNFEGGTVNQANFEVFWEEFFNYKGVYKLTGGHDSYGIAIRLADLTDDMIATLEALEEYPTLDDELVSAKEHDAIEDAWLSWAHYDFQRALERHLPAQEEAISAMPEAKLLELFGKLKERIGADWVIESGGKAYIEVNRLAESCTEEDLGV